MSNISLRTQVTSLEVTGGGYNAVDVELDGLDVDDCLKEIAMQDAIDYYGDDSLLDAIGEEAARKYWGIKDEDEAAA